MNCPICGKDASEEHAPFCSRRCAFVDLDRWLSGSYRISTPSDDEVMSDQAQPDPEQLN